MALLGGLLIPSGPAWANAAAPFVRVPSNEGGAFLARPTALVVEHEALDFRCDARSCDFRAVYQIYNPSDAREEVLGAFYGIRTEDFEATGDDGSNARQSLTTEQRQAVDDAVGDPEVTRDPSIRREGFIFGVDAHGRGTLVFAGRMAPVLVSGGRSGYAVPPTQERHPWLGTEYRTERVERYDYALSPIRSWRGSPNIDVTVRCSDPACWASGQEGWTTTDEGAGFVARRTIRARDASMLSFALVPEHRTMVLNGGPLVGAGGRLSPGQFQARFGYEAAIPHWLVWSASVETNFKDTTTIVPLGEIASPSILFIIPSVGIGAGVPVQIRSGSGAFVGVRGQLTVSFPVMSIVLPVDVFPGASSDVWQVGLFGQATF